jgi:phosphoribosylaminoimidazole-succinocarboxamide synthase
MGTVKDLEVVLPPEERRLGVGRFHFSDRYSVFDWGEMPDTIPDRGKALCAIGAFFFERMAEKGIPTHYLGVGEGVSLREHPGPPRRMTVRLLRVIRPDRGERGYDYRIFTTLSGNYLIPLEVIFRFALPAGSSVFRRIAQGELSPHALGVQSPVEGMRLTTPFLDFSTKLEDGDRYLTEEQALKLSGLKEKEFQELKGITLKVSHLIADTFAPMGIEVEDGKIEFGITPERELIVVDVAGTPDECRLSFEGVPLSKELLRLYYRRSPWYRKVEEEKRKGGNWRSRVPSPPPLPEEWREVVSLLYRSLAGTITGIPFFEGETLSRVVLRIQDLLER